MKDSSGHKLPTQKDIADSLGISRGTVDRALHNRKGVNKETKKMILKKAGELGYSPNKQAQFLVSGKTLSIAFITPGDPLWNEVRKGADSFLNVMGDHFLKIKWYKTSVHDPNREREILQKVIDSRNVEGIGIAPADPKMLTDLINTAVKNNIAVVTLNTDAPECKRLCFVGQDSILAGKIGGELMGKFLMGRGKVVVITAFKNVLAHRNRLRSFLKIINDYYPDISVEEIFENHDSEEEAYRHIKGFLSKSGEIDWIYLTTGNGPVGVTDALKEFGLAGKSRIVCFDFFPETVKLLKSGLVHATIGQDPFSQGYQTVKLLYDYIIDKKEPMQKVVHTRIEIGLRENIDFLVTKNHP